MTDNFNELLFGFKEHLKVKNYSKASIGHYTQTHLQGFFEYLRANNITDIRGVTRDILKAYQLKITEYRAHGKGYTVSTISVKIRAVKRFFEYLEASSLILVNPAEYIKEPKKENRLPRVILTEDEVRKIFDQPNLSTRVGIRDRTVLEVFYSTGIRLEELINLTIFDCDLQGGMLRVNKGKMAKDRVVPLGRHAVKFLKEYITNVRPYYTKRIWSTNGQRILFPEQIRQSSFNAGCGDHGENLCKACRNKKEGQSSCLPSYLCNRAC